MNGNLNFKSPLLWIGLLGLAAIAVMTPIWISNLFPSGNASQPLTMTAAMMVGLALIAGLVIVLLIFFKATQTEDKTQALGWPSGSVRAVLALILVLMFVGMGIYLYRGVSDVGPGVTLHGLTHDQVVALQAQFTSVIPLPEPVKPAPVNGTAATPPEQLFTVTYCPHSKEADDLAKQMFTQLATVFVTVIGFYFGSSSTTSGLNAAVNVIKPKPGGTDPNSTGSSDGTSPGVPGALQEAKALSHDASAGLDQIQSVLNHPAENSADKDAVQKIFDDAQTTVKSIQEKVKAATDAAAKFGTSTSNDENNAAAAAVIKARDEIKTLTAAIKKNVDDATAKLPAAN